MRVAKESETKDILLGRVMRIIALVVFIIVVINASIAIYSTYRNTMDTVDGIVLSNIQYFELEEQILKSEEAVFHPEMLKIFEAFENAYTKGGKKVSKNDFKKLKQMTNKPIDFYVVSPNGIVLQSTYAKDVGIDLFKIPGIKNDLSEVKSKNQIIATPLVASYIEKTLMRYYRYPLKQGGFLEISIKFDAINGHYNQLMTKKFKYVKSIGLLDHLGRNVLSAAGDSNGLKESDNIEVSKEHLAALNKMDALEQRYVQQRGLQMTILEPIYLKFGNEASVDNRYIRVTLDFRDLVCGVLGYMMFQILLLLGVILVAYRAINRFFIKILSELDESRNRGVLTEKLDLFGAMISKVGHELNTPMGVLITAVSYLKMMLAKLTGKLEQCGDKQDLEVLENINEAMSLVDSSMDTTKEIVHKFQTLLRNNLHYELGVVSVIDVIERVVFDFHLNIEKKNMKIHIVGDKGIVLMTNEKAFLTIFSNLVENVLQHGPIYDRAIEIYVNVWHSDGWIHIRFEDNGKGVAAEKLDQVFIPFYTTKSIKGNVGLGLTFVHNYIVETMHGKIDCYVPEEFQGFGILMDIPDGA